MASLTKPESVGELVWNETTRRRDRALARGQVGFYQRLIEPVVTGSEVVTGDKDWPPWEDPPTRL